MGSLLAHKIPRRVVRHGVAGPKGVFGVTGLVYIIA